MNNLTDSTLPGLLLLIHRLQQTGQLLGRETILPSLSLHCRDCLNQSRRARRARLQPGSVIRPAGRLFVDQGEIYEDQSGRGNYLCNRFFRGGCLLDRAGCRCTLGRVCNGWSIPRTVPAWVKSGSTGSGSDPPWVDCGGAGSGGTQFSRMVSVLALADMGGGSIRDG